MDEETKQIFPIAMGIMGFIMLMGVVLMTEDTLGGLLVVSTAIGTTFLFAFIYKNMEKQKEEGE